MNKSEIKSSLINKLTQSSTEWGDLVNSVIGRELVAFGVELISELEGVKQSLTDGFNYKTANDRALLSMAFTMDTAISFTRPSYIKIRFETRSNIVYKPFQIKYTIGNTNFYNIDYVVDTHDITLYQGTVKFRTSDNDQRDRVGFGGEHISSNYWEDAKLVISESETIGVVSVGNAMPESIFKFNIDSTPRLISTYRPIKDSSNIESYKVKTLFDKNIVVQNPDGKWGRVDSGKYQITWLAPTNNKFSTTTNQVDIIQSGTSVKKVVTILTSSLGLDDDITYARDLIRKQFLKLNAVVSEKQITEFVNAFEFVQDSAVTAMNGRVEVHVKPTDHGDVSTFDEITQELTKYGSLSTRYQVTKGTPIDIQLEITGELSDFEKNDIKTLICDEYAYNNMGMSSVMDLSAIIASVRKITNAGIGIKYIVNNVTPNKKLSVIPSQGEVIVGSWNNMKGFDYKGSIYQTDKTQESFNGYNAFSVGNYIYDEHSFLKIRSFSKTQDLVAIPRVQMWPQKKPYANGKYTYVQGFSESEVYIDVYPNEFFTPDSCAFEDIKPLASWTIQNEGDASTNNEVRLSAENKRVLPYPVLWDINTLLLIDIKENVLKIKFYSSNNPRVEYYVLAIGTTAQKVLGYRREGDNLRIILPNKEILISNIDGLAVTWEEQSNISSTVGAITGFETVENTTVVRTIATAISAKYYKMNQELSSASEMGVGDTTGLSITKDGIFIPNLGFYINDTVKTTTGIFIVSKINTGTPVGTINYRTGELLYNGSENLSYKSVNINKQKSEYLVLNNTTPIIWNQE